MNARRIGAAMLAIAAGVASLWSTEALAGPVGRKRGSKTGVTRRTAYRAPRIGASLASLPVGYRTVVVAGRTHFAHAGDFYRREPGGFVVVAAPIGAALVTLPTGSQVVRVGGATYHFLHGAFYAWNPARRSYLVVAPPRGAAVATLPDAATSIRIDGVRYFELGGVRYRPQYRNGRLLYVVTAV